MEGCIFCRIAEHGIPAQTVYEDDYIVAFKDVNPVAPVHLLIIPKQHIPGIASLAADNLEVVTRIWELIPRLARDFHIVEDGFRVVVNSGQYAGPSVPHLHFHLLGGRPMGWPPG